MGDDAIVAHAAPVHAPQRRVQVRHASRSVVIRERGWSDRTVVVPKRVMQRFQAAGRRSAWQLWLVWALAGAVAFAVGCLLALKLLGGRSEPARAAIQPQPAVAAPATPRANRSSSRAHPVTTPPAATPAAAQGPATERVVSVHELPLESTHTR